MIQPVNIPVPFNLLHTADLIGWHGDRAHAGYQDVVKQVKELAGKSHVKPLKPPPNRALRALWRTVAVVGVIAVIGASVWVFRPWETLAPKDPVVEAKKEAAEKRETALNSLAPFGLGPGDLDRYSSRYIAERVFKPETRASARCRSREGRSRRADAAMRRRALDHGRRPAQLRSRRSDLRESQPAPANPSPTPSTATC